MHFQPPVSASLIEEIFRSRKPSIFSQNIRGHIRPHCPKVYNLCFKRWPNSLGHSSLLDNAPNYIVGCYIQMTWVYIGISSIRNQNIGIFFRCVTLMFPIFKVVLLNQHINFQVEFSFLLLQKWWEGFWCGNSFSSLFELQYNDKKVFIFHF